MLNWLWNGNDVTEDVIPENAVGFVYKIEHIPTGKYYIGKKSLQSVRNVKIGVRELQRIKEERKLAGIRGSLPKKKKVRKSSDWQKYFSSNDWIKEQITEGKSDEFKRKYLNSAIQRNHYLIMKYIINSNITYFQMINHSTEIY